MFGNTKMIAKIDDGDARVYDDDDDDDGEDGCGWR